MSVTLAITYHDPHSRLSCLVERVLPLITATFAGVVVQASSVASARSLALFADAGAIIGRDQTEQLRGAVQLGRARRAAVRLALGQRAAYILMFDGDRLLHWASTYPDEMEQVVADIPRYDFTVLGRTPRAIATHPDSQADTEQLVNRLFAGITRQAWDVMAAARGLSRRAATTILEGCPDEGISVDVTWPLFLQKVGGFTQGYIPIEGLEFETPDRYAPEIIAAGGIDAWMARVDADPRRWAHRLNLALLHTEAMIPYASADTHLERT
jgi:hypothetical protein